MPSRSKTQVSLCSKSFILPHAPRGVEAATILYNEIEPIYSIKHECNNIDGSSGFVLQGFVFPFEDFLQALEV
jgi:hypothetical protein